ncbi:hypothetical protein PIROE2DRAFT_64495 [Piromyces sp. E2]|nr:hypothetical protein PIROE2DRAFT_64495 [Piromyces sp. E2]|eukprot:OUM58314.1 hypothetical protein PIROE2DRAFT_64495 [Piromyces sp. E2]
MNDLGKNSVERTLSIPLWSRAIAVKKLTKILPDHDAVRILNEMGETKPPSILYNFESGALAGAIRQYNLACEIKDYLKTFPEATIVELGAGLSCLRKQINNDTNAWVNIDFPDVIACREKYIQNGKMEKNIASDITCTEWFNEIPFEKNKGIVFIAAGVLHYLTYESVKNLISKMAERFPGGLFAFDFVSEKAVKGVNNQISKTDNETTISFTMENSEEEIPTFSENISKVIQKSYFEAYPLPDPDIKFSLITKMYIKSKRDKFFMTHVEFKN